MQTCTTVWRHLTTAMATALVVILARRSRRTVARLSEPEDSSHGCGKTGPVRPLPANHRWHARSVGHLAI